MGRIRLMERMAALEAQDENQEQAKDSKADSKIELTEAPELNVTLGVKDEGDDGDGVIYGPFNSIEEMLEKMQELEAQSKNQDVDK